jgi:hypothetical protein
MEKACMAAYQSGDFVKAEFEDVRTGEKEWMWVRVDYADDDKQLVFGSLDSQPVLDHGGGLKLGSQLAVTYDNILQCRKASE